MAYDDTNSMAQQFIKFIEGETKRETEKIVDRYKEQIEKDLEAVRARIVAQAGVRLSEIMTIENLGRTIRIEIIKREEPR